MVGISTTVRICVLSLSIFSSSSGLHGQIHKTYDSFICEAYGTRYKVRLAQSSCYGLRCANPLCAMHRPPDEMKKGMSDPTQNGSQQRSALALIVGLTNQKGEGHPAAGAACKERLTRGRKHCNAYMRG
ncbi:hypothetical protein BJV74DRAFT_107413 [Russula compacta]|nr:hypothetical protein BJV74DRAFT_107413 [Russula compacta]